MPSPALLHVGSIHNVLADEQLGFACRDTAPTCVEVFKHDLGSRLQQHPLTKKALNGKEGRG